MTRGPSCSARTCAPPGCPRPTAGTMGRTRPAASATRSRRWRGPRPGLGSRGTTIYRQPCEPRAQAGKEHTSGSTSAASRANHGRGRAGAGMTVLIVSGRAGLRHPEHLGRPRRWGGEGPLGAGPANQGPGRTGSCPHRLCDRADGTTAPISPRASGSALRLCSGPGAVGLGGAQADRSRV